MSLNHKLLLTLCLALFGSSCRDVKIGKIEARDVSVKVGGVDVSVTIGAAEKERDDVARQLEEVKAQLAAKDAQHAEERAKLQERQLALQERLLTLTEQLATLRQGDANLRNELAKVRAELKANSEELARLRAAISARAEVERQSSPAPAARGDEAAEPEADVSSVSFALLENDTRCRLTYSIVGEDGSLEARSIAAGERVVLERSGDGIEVEFDGYRSSLQSVTRVGGRARPPAASELPVNCFDFDEDGEVGVFHDEDE